MLGLFLIYFVGKAFYQLAELYNKSKWGFAVLGVASYYAGTFFFGVAIGLSNELGWIDTGHVPEIGLSLMGIPFGILACWGLYKILERQWSKPSKFTDEEILDS